MDMCCESANKPKQKKNSQFEDIKFDTEKNEKIWEKKFFYASF